MSNQATISELLRQAADLLPSSAASLREEFKHNLKPLVEASFAKLDLVTREEFDQQRLLLEQLQQRATQLEAELKTLQDTNQSAQQ